MSTPSVPSLLPDKLYSLNQFTSHTIQVTRLARFSCRLAELHSVCWLPCCDLPPSSFSLSLSSLLSLSHCPPPSLSLTVLPPSPQTKLIFWTDYQKILPTPELYTSDAVKATISLHPIKDPLLMYRVHQYMHELRSGHQFRTPV